MDKEWEEFINNDEIDEYDYNEMYFKKGENGTIFLITYFAFDEADIVVPEGVTSIDNYAFESSEIRSVKLPDSLSSIGVRAFHNCDNLAKVQLGRGSKVIKKHAFSGCDKLKELFLPSSVTVLGDSSLGDVSDIILESKKIPRRLPLCSNQRSKSASLKIHFGERTIIIPKRSIADWSNLNQVLEDFLKNEKGNLVMPHIASSIEDKQEVALEGFRLEHDPKLKPILTEGFPDIMARRKNEEDFRSLFIEFLDEKMMTNNMTRDALRIAHDRNWTETAAYLLEKINGYEYENEDFSL